jgi:hypothetical protein
LQDTPKFTQIGIFWLKKCHLATLFAAMKQMKGRVRGGKGGAVAPNQKPFDSGVQSTKQHCTTPRNSKHCLHTFLSPSLPKNHLSHWRNSDSDRCGILFYAGSGTVVWIPKLLALPATTYILTCKKDPCIHTEAISGRTISWASRRDVAEEWWHIFYLMRRLNNTYMNTIVYVVMRQHFSRATKKWKRFCFGSHNQNVAQPKCCLRQNFIFFVQTRLLSRLST